MLQTNWKSTALMAGISGVSAILLLSAVIATVYIALFTNIGIGSWLLLLLITIATSPLTVRVASDDGILRSPMGDVSPTGRSVRVDYIQVLRFREGKHCSFNLMFDRLLMLEQLGLLPAPAPAG